VTNAATPKNRVSPLTNRRDDHLRRSARAAHGIGGTGARHEIAVEADVDFAKSRRTLAAASDRDRLRGEVWIGVQKGGGNRRRRLFDKIE